MFRFSNIVIIIVIKIKNFQLYEKLLYESNIVSYIKLTSLKLITI